MPKPSSSNYAVYFQRYIDQVPEEDLFIAFENQQARIHELLTLVSEERSSFAYAEGKWTLKELLQHIIDTERIFNYRALCIARKEKVSLPGFDENQYAAHSNANNRTWKSLVNELLVVRESTGILYTSFSEEALNSIGISNNNPISVYSLGFITVGHFYHHEKIIKERYLV
jgi:hypothetical protein